MENKRIVITGVSGFLGTHVADLFQSYDCAFLLNTRTPNQSLLARNRLFYSASDLAASLPHPDVIIHLAAHIPYGRFNEPSKAFEEINVGLTERLACAFPQARWVFASSVSVYGQCKEPVVTAATSTQPNSLYALSKLRAEQAISTLNNFAIIRFSSLIGPGMRPISLIPKWIEDAKREKRISVWGNGTRMQNYLDVRDAARLVYLLATNTFKGIVLGIGPREYSNCEVAHTISELVSAEITYTPHADEWGMRYDDRTHHEHIGFKPQFELRETIRQMMES
jgi:UDP-glucose 4-epimerase